MVRHDKIVCVEWFVNMVFDTDWNLWRSNEFEVDFLSDDFGMKSEHEVRGGVDAVTERCEL